jgi:phosphoglycolate phosphatase
MYGTVLFDLDGTLTDPGIGITNSVMYALKKYGIEPSDRSELYKFIGPPLTESFERFYGFTPDQAKEAVEFYREYFKDKGIFENRPYEGIDVLLSSLKNAGMTLAVATSKPEVFAAKILEHFDLAKYFTVTAGSNLDGSRISKADVINYALETLNVNDKASVLMVGDREHDVIGAKAAGIASMGVLYGYGSRKELEEAGAECIAETVEELKNWLLQHASTAG